MDGLSDEDLVVPRGSRQTIAWARDASGRRHAKDFLESEAPEKDRARLYHHFRVLAEHGRISNREVFRKETETIWGFKSYQVRIGAFQDGRVWYLTHGFIKKKDKWPKQEFERAERIRSEHLARKGKR